ncbi:MAG: molybdenum cofactor guanylyltransferase [Planctomycetota bacterium]
MTPPPTDLPSPSSVPLAWQLGVLVGGRGRRMGRDKARLPFRGRTLLEHQISRCAPPGATVLLAIGDRDDRPGEGVGRRLLADRLSGVGPLAGLEVLRAEAEAPILVVVPCDMPNLDRAELERLVADLRAGGADLARFASAGVVQPLPVALAADCGPRLSAALESGHRKLLGWEDGLRSLAIEPSRPEILRNLNTAEDFAAAGGDPADVDGGARGC